MTLKFYTRVAKGLKLKVRKFWMLYSTFVEATGEKLVRGGGGGFSPPIPILNRVNDFLFIFAGIYGKFYKKLIAIMLDLS